MKLQPCQRQRRTASLHAHGPTLDEVRSHLEYGAQHTRRCLLPDIVEWRDFRAAPELVRQQLLAQIRDGRSPARASRFPYPKAGTNEVRLVTVLNPYDELVFRYTVGRAARIIDQSLSTDVMSYRLDESRPAWRYRGQREAFKLRSQSGIQSLENRDCNALLMTDIRNYFPSITTELLAKVLQEIGLPDPYVISIVDFLSQLTILGAPEGLPIGPEASSLLGNIAMLPVDLAIAEVVTRHIRYTDDSWLFLRSASDAEEVLARYREAASACGFDLNDNKVKLYDKADGSAHRAIQHEMISYFESYFSGNIPPDRAHAEFRDQITSQEPDWAVCRYLLSKMNQSLDKDASKSHEEMLNTISEYPTVMRELPEQAGRYICTLAKNKHTRDKIDRDWLVKHVASPLTSRDLAGRLQVCRAGSLLKLGKDHGRRMETIATNFTRQSHIPIRIWAARAWGASEAHTPAKAVEFACEFGDFSLRRAFVTTISSEAFNLQKRNQCREKLIKVDRDLLPSVAHWQ